MCDDMWWSDAREVAQLAEAAKASGGAPYGAVIVDLLTNTNVAEGEWLTLSYFY
jgi:hypothetical protein